jgi:hypothetical protein
VIPASGFNYATVTLNIVTGATNTSLFAPPAVSGTAHRGLFFCLLPGVALLALGLRRKTRTRLTLTLFIVSLISLVGFSGCAYNVAATSPTPTGTYTVVVTATGTPNVVSTTTNVVVTSNLSLTVTKY